MITLSPYSPTKALAYALEIVWISDSLAQAKGFLIGTRFSYVRVLGRFE